MSKAAMNLQDSFLNQVRRENSEVRVLLVNGTLLRGIVKGFDNFTLILNNRNGQHLVYKHAIAQIVTQQPRMKAEDLAAHDQPAGESTDEAPAVAAGNQPVEEAAATPSAQAENKGPAESKGPARRDHKGQQRDRGNKGPRQDKPKKEGFNTLDLSGLKLSEKQG